MTCYNDHGKCEEEHDDEVDQEDYGEEEDDYMLREMVHSYLDILMYCYSTCNSKKMHLQNLICSPVTCVGPRIL